MSHATIDLRIQSDLVRRGLLRDREILHRDINPANILWRDLNSIPTAGAAPVSTSSIGHLLNSRYVALPMWELDPIQLYASEPRHKSSAILINSNHAEISKSTKHVRSGRSVSSVHIFLIP